MFKVTPKQCKAIAKLTQSPDEYHTSTLEGVYFTTQGAMTGVPALVVTDRHRLAEIPVWVTEGTEDTDGIIPTAALKAADGKPYAVLGVNEKVTVTTLAGVIEVAKMDGQYPDYRQVVPPDADRVSIDSIAFNAKYLLELVQAMDPDSPNTKAFLTFTGKEKPILVETENGARGLLMPMVS
jgi:DNA polymerase III sliding clamp (beta) subunit (PCNA family)